MALISCQQASFGYDTGVVLEELDFSVNAGDYLCIVGENGSGKSTLIKGILGLKEPLKGVLSIGDGLKQNEIGYLPQQSSAQKDFPAGVMEVVISGRQSKRGLRPFYSKADKAAANENLQKLGIESLKKKCFRELSGGQQQRTLLARALCATEKMILLDEPVAGLDPIATQELYQVVKRLNVEEKITVIMVSHDMHSAVEYATHILHLGRKQLFFGRTEEYLKTELAGRFIGGERFA